MKDQMLLTWLWTRHGRDCVNDEGNDKGPIRLDEMPEEYEVLPVTPQQTRAGQYMRRLRRMERKGRHRGTLHDCP